MSTHDGRRVAGTSGRPGRPTDHAFAARTTFHLISITNASVDPALSVAPALFAGGGYVGRFWLFLVAPVAGAMIASDLAGLLYGNSIAGTGVVVERRVET